MVDIHIYPQYFDGTVSLNIYLQSRFSHIPYRWKVSSMKISSIEKITVDMIFA